MKEVMDQIWQFFYDYRVEFIIALVIALIIIIITTPLRNLFRKLWELIFPPADKKKEQDRKLRIHFEDLKSEARKITANLGEVYGEIMGTSDRLYWHHLKEDELPQLSNSFAAHFSEEATKWTKYTQAIKVHNRAWQDFRLKIRNAFQSKGIDVEAGGRVYPSPYIYDFIFKPLLYCWRDRREGRVTHLDFEKVGTKPDSPPNRLFVEGWGAEPIAYAETESHRETCKRVIHEVAQNADYEREAANLLGAAYRLITQVEALVQQLNDKLDNVAKFWPGTRSYRFEKEKKNCPKCKEVFG